MSDQQDESGLVGAEVLPFVVLVFIVGTLVFTQAWAALDAKLAAAAAMTLVGLALYEHAYVQAGQSVPQS